MKDCYLELDVNVTHRAGGHARYADGDHIKLVNLGSFASFGKYRLRNASVKEKEEIDNAHVICLMYRLLSSSGDNDDFSVGFNGSIETLETELANIEGTKGNYLVRVYLKDVFAFAEHHDTCTYGLG